MKLLLRSIPLVLFAIVASGSGGVPPQPQPEPPIQSTECYSFDSTYDDCYIGEFPNGCASTVNVTGAYQTGSGLKKSEYRSQPCLSCSGGTISVPTAVDNPLCCDRDNDGSAGPQCSGGTDCNDNDASIKPGVAENCVDGIDNNCNGQTDCAEISCVSNPACCQGAGGFCVQDSNCCSGNHCDYNNSICTGNTIGCSNQHLIDDCWYSGGSPNPPPSCNCHWGGPGSPIIIDVLGNGFDLTNAANGVYFQLKPDGTLQHMSWTAPGADDAFLVLDRNGNGTIDTGMELFGNFTRQPEPPAGLSRNGFNALTPFNKRKNGGNGDGEIDRRDAVFATLRLWQDVNHNGVSEQSELHGLQELGVESISLDYKESRRTDQYGNRFKYRAKVDDARHSHVGRWAWDVFFVDR